MGEEGGKEVEEDTKLQGMVPSLAHAGGLKLVMEGCLQQARVTGLLLLPPALPRLSALSARAQGSLKNCSYSGLFGWLPFPSARVPSLSTSTSRPVGGGEVHGHAQRINP